MPWKPAPCALPTRFAAGVDPASPLPDYPRPRLERERWLSLNGPWDYAILPASEARPGVWDGQILVPFAVESSLSGVGRALRPEQRLWYRRDIGIPAAWSGSAAVALNFGAVDYDCEVWLDGELLGAHRGGFLPFSFDLPETSGRHELVVSVTDPSDSGSQARGKQALRPGGIFYSAVSGIWQTVWIEPVPPRRIVDLVMRPEFARDELGIELLGTAGEGFRVSLRSAGSQLLKAEGRIGTELMLPFRGAHPWSPEDPFLYDLDIETESGDRARSFFAWRSFGVGVDGKGRRRFFLNGKPYFLHGVLDQGYWPDGLYTAPTDEALAFDLLSAKRLGFTMVRKHAKVECARWYAHAARLGIIVFQDMPSGGRRRNPFLLGALALAGLRLRDRGGLARLFLGRGDSPARRDFLEELAGLVRFLRGEPAVASFSPFNEGWGQFDAMAATALIRGIDPGRPVDEASGWFDQGGGDFNSVHRYSKRLPAPPRETGRAWFLSEYGGLTHSLPGRTWPGGREFGYRRFTNLAELEAAYLDLLGVELCPKIEAGLAASVYTQLTDVEQETNGLVTYDREVFKVEEGKVSAAVPRRMKVSKKLSGSSSADIMMHEGSEVCE